MKSDIKNRESVKTKLKFYCHTNDDSAAPVYISGSLNKWKVYDEAFKMMPGGRGVFKLEVVLEDTVPLKGEYLYTRGGWGEVERDNYGNKVPNRVWDTSINEYHDRVPRWADEGRAFRDYFLPIREVISEKYYIPQLKKSRRVQILLPHNYYESDWSYPVLYLHDGQNLFDKYAPFGSWAIDEKLAVLAEKGMGDIIVVAIDHGGVDRINEFTPYSGKTYAEGRNYVKFITETLKPDIDKKYRTLQDRANTGIGGSSMGGLISIYAGIIHPETYGKLMIFSPSLWASKSIYFEAIQFKKALETKIYLYAGGAESKNMVPNVRKFKEVLEMRGLDRKKLSFKLSLDPEGKHSESFWGAEFPKAVEWLFFTSQNLY